MTDLYQSPEYWERKRKASEGNSPKPPPAPRLEYAEVWGRLGELQQLSQELRDYLAQIEDRTPETDAEVHRKLELLQFVVEQAAKNVASAGYVKKEDPGDF
jgi:hypothetical protein